MGDGFQRKISDVDVDTDSDEESDHDGAPETAPRFFAQSPLAPIRASSAHLMKTK